MRIEHFIDIRYLFFDMRIDHTDTLLIQMKQFFLILYGIFQTSNHFSFELLSELFRSLCIIFD